MKTISVAIPAYNEEENIQKILMGILYQNEDGYILEKIYVLLDGCTDRTYVRAKEVEDKRIIVINDGKRLGKSGRMNQAFLKNTSDILVLPDADVLFGSRDIFSNIARSDLKKAGLAATNYDIIAENFFARCLRASIHLQEYVRDKWNNGQNFLPFKGACMIFDYQFARSTQIPKGLINSDTYMYLSARNKGLSPIVIKDTCVLYKVPTRLLDHIAQSSRFASSRQELEKYFLINSQGYTIPKLLLIKGFFNTLINEPIYIVGYIIITIITRLKQDRNISATWKQASSTKNLA